jgi:preprotein translocase subunit SecG
VRVVATVIHILALVVALASVLLQSGKGAGFMGPVGGGLDIFFGKTRGLDEGLMRITAVSAAVFFATSYYLAHVWA